MAEYAIYALAAVQAGVAVDQHNEAKKARRLSEDMAAKDRDALAQLQSEGAPGLPTVDDASVRTAKRRSISEQLRRRGRASTILTGDGDTLGA